MLSETITTLNRKYAVLYKKAMAKIPMLDEYETLNYIETMYEQITNFTVKKYLELAQEIYKKETGDFWEDVTLHSLYTDLLEVYDPVTKYIWTNEMDRKRARLYESVMASKKMGASEVRKEIRTAERLMSKMNTQYAISTWDYATIAGYKKNGVKYVRWQTAEDERVCEECNGLDGKIFSIKNVPARPHWNCRCMLVSEDSKTHGQKSL